jgi:hypothetical protein
VLSDFLTSSLAGALLAGALLLVAWPIAFCLWMLMAIVAGACQGG